MELNLDYIDNCSHGYVKVLHNDLIKVIEDPKLISGYSGIDKRYVYLEEDADASLFIAKAKEKGITLNFTDVYRPKFNTSHNYHHSKVNAGKSNMINGKQTKLFEEGVKI